MDLRKIGKNLNLEPDSTTGNGTSKETEQALKSVIPELTWETGGVEDERTEALFARIASLKPTNPVICVQDDLKIPFFYDDQEMDISKLIQERSIEKGQFSLTVTYNAATKKITVPEASEDAWYKAAIFVGSSPEENMIPQLQDPKILSPAHVTHEAFFGVAQQIIQQVEDNPDIPLGVMLIVDRAECLFPGNQIGKSNPVNSDAVSRIGALKEHVASNAPGSRVIFIDRTGKVGESEGIRREITVNHVPEMTRQEVERVLKEAGCSEITEEVLEFGEKLSPEEIRTLIQEVGTQPDELQRAMIRRLEKKIYDESEGVLEFEYVDMDEDEIYLSPKEKEMWDDLADIFLNDPKKASRGLTMAGPPGTGKTFRMRYFASRIGCPCFRLGNISSDGLRGKKEERLRRVFHFLTSFKPCILFIDEVADKFSEGQRGDKDDSESDGFLKEILTSPQMEGVLVVSSANDLSKMDASIAGEERRLGNVIAVLPPHTPEERRGIFLKVFQEIHGKGAQLDGDFLTYLGETLPNGSTPDDYRMVIKNADSKKRRCEREGSPISDMEAINLAIEEYDFQKDQSFMRRVSEAMKFHKHEIRFWETDEDEAEEKLTKEQKDRRAFFVLAAELQQKAMEVERREKLLVEGAEEIEKLDLEIAAKKAALSEMGEACEEKSQAIKDLEAQRQKIEREIGKIERKHVAKGSKLDRREEELEEGAELLAHERENQLEEIKRKNEELEATVAKLRTAQEDDEKKAQEQKRAEKWGKFKAWGPVRVPVTVGSWYLEMWDENPIGAIFLSALVGGVGYGGFKVADRMHLSEAELALALESRESIKEVFGWDELPADKVVVEFAGMQWDGDEYSAIDWEHNTWWGKKGVTLTGSLHEIPITVTINTKPDHASSLDIGGTVFEYDSVEDLVIFFNGWKKRIEELSGGGKLFEPEMKLGEVLLNRVGFDAETYTTVFRGQFNGYSLEVTFAPTQEGVKVSLLYGKHRAELDSIEALEAWLADFPEQVEERKAKALEVFQSLGGGSNIDEPFTYDGKQIKIHYFSDNHRRQLEDPFAEEGILYVFHVTIPEKKGEVGFLAISSDGTGSIFIRNSVKEGWNKVALPQAQRYIERCNEKMDF